MCRAHSNQNQNLQNSIQFKWRQISLGDSTSGVDAHEPEPARTRSRTSDRMFDSYVVVTTSLFKQRDAGLQLHGSRSSSATCTERTCPTNCKSWTRSTRSSTLWPSRASQATPLSDSVVTSAHRATDGFSEPLQAGCIGGHVHRKISPKFLEPSFFVSDNCDLSVIMAEVSIGVSSVIPITLLELPCRSEQLLSSFN